VTARGNVFTAATYGSFVLVEASYLPEKCFRLLVYFLILVQPAFSAGADSGSRDYRLE